MILMALDHVRDFFGNAAANPTDPATTTVALFFTRLLAIHLLAVLVCSGRYGETHWIFESPGLDRFPFARPPGWGVDLPVVYLMWACVVMALYPLCRWFAAVKQRHRDGWLSFV